MFLGRVTGHVVASQKDKVLNGQKLLEYEAGSPDWESRLKASKFATWPKYGRLPKGHIGIQGDHEGELSIRNMRIRTLP